MKVSVAVIREAELALKQAADRAMAEGAHELEASILVQTSAKVRWPELVAALVDAGLIKRKG